MEFDASLIVAPQYIKMVNINSKMRILSQQIGVSYKEPFMYLNYQYHVFNEKSLHSLQMSRRMRQVDHRYIELSSKVWGDET